MFSGMQDFDFASIFFKFCSNPTRFA